MTTSFADSPWWWEDVLEQADRMYVKHLYPLEWWLTVAAETAKLGVDKAEFTGLVSNRYSSDENRFQASVAWDINKLGESSD